VYRIGPVAEALVFDIQPFSIHDGPGVRTTVFLKGCNLRCRWCHNPESQGAGRELFFTASRCIGCGACAEACPRGEAGKTARFSPRCTGCGACAEVCYAGALSVAGRPYGAGELAALVLRDRDLFRRSGGGITFSGGEPLLQADFVGEVFSLLRGTGIHRAVETAAALPWEVFRGLLPLTDLFICDLKAPGEELHREGTGAGNALIRENIRALSASGAELLLRIPVIPGYNDREEIIAGCGDFIASLPGRHRVELLGFHNICAGKYDSLGREFPYRGVPAPSPERMEALASALRNRKLKGEIVWN
jgi:pyruvate formate lyase activating enzyme